MAPGNPVNDKQQHTRDSETPGSADGSGCELGAHLLVVSFPPATGGGSASFTIECGNPGSGEKAGEDVADVAADAVNGEDIEAFVDGDVVFVFGGKEAGCCCYRTDESGDVDGDYWIELVLRGMYIWG